MTDVSVIEDAPFHADVAASRVHRWTRGDWQLLPFLLHAGRFALRAINRWKMLDNLRRSLVAPASLALLASRRSPPACVSPWAALALVAARLLGRAADGRDRRPGAEPRRHRRARHFYRQALADLARALAERRLAARAAAASSR